MKALKILIIFTLISSIEEIVVIKNVELFLTIIGLGILGVILSQKFLSRH